MICKFVICLFSPLILRDFLKIRITPLYKIIHYITCLQVAQCSINVHKSHDENCRICGILLINILCFCKWLICTYTLNLLGFSLALHQTLDITIVQRRSTQTHYIVDNDYSLFTHLYIQGVYVSTFNREKICTFPVQDNSYN